MRFNAPVERWPTGTDTRTGKKPALRAVPSTGWLGGPVCMGNVVFTSLLSESIHQCHRALSRAFDWVVDFIWDDWLLVRTAGKQNHGGKLCFERGFADAVLNAVVVNRGIEEELAHLHAVTSDFFEEINVDFILVVSDLPYVSLPVPQHFLRLIRGVETIVPTLFSTPTKRLETKCLTIEESIQFPKKVAATHEFCALTLLELPKARDDIKHKLVGETLVAEVFSGVTDAPKAGLLYLVS